MLENFQFADFISTPIDNSPVWFRKMEDQMFGYFNTRRRKAWQQINRDNIDYKELKTLFCLHVLNSIKDNFDHERFPETTKLVNEAIEMYNRTTTPFDFKKLSEKCHLKATKIENERVKQILLATSMVLSDFIATAVLNAVKTYDEEVPRCEQLNLTHKFYEKFLIIFFEYAEKVN